jgi:Flp pilus assembly protein TadD
MGLLVTWSLAIAAAQMRPTLEGLIRDGHGAIEAGDFSRALSDFEEAYRLAPGNQEVKRGLVLSCLQTGQISRAIDLT